MVEVESEEEKREKRVAFYSVLAEAWLGTRMEKDRTLLALSTGGLGLLASFLTDERSTSCVQLILYAIAAVAFLAAVSSLLIIFSRNTKVLEDAMKGGNGKDATIEILDGVAACGFVAGAIATIVLGFTFTNHEGVPMADTADRIETTSNVSRVERIVPEGPVEIRSYSGVGAIDPGAVASPTAPAATPSASPASAGDSGGSAPAVNDSTTE